MNKPKIKLQLVSGEPKISNLEITDQDVFCMEVGVIGVPKDQITLLLGDGKFQLIILEGSSWTPVSNVIVDASAYDFRQMVYYKGVNTLSLSCPVRTTLTLGEILQITL